MWVANATFQPLLPQQRRGTHYIGGWVDSSRSGQVREISPLSGFNHLTVQPVGSRDCAIRVHNVGR